MVNVLFDEVKIEISVSIKMCVVSVKWMYVPSASDPVDAGAVPVPVTVNEVSVALTPRLGTDPPAEYPAMSSSKSPFWIGAAPVLSVAWYSPSRFAIITDVYVRVSGLATFDTACDVGTSTVPTVAAVALNRRSINDT